ncbi:MAG: hypothetical protein HYU63_05490 [Armatimonadetes bacterium]|nr:hypothetical protein [Armatimonadota bacterium]
MKNRKLIINLLIFILISLLWNQAFSQESRPVIDKIIIIEPGNVKAEEIEEKYQDALKLFEKGKIDAAIYQLQETAKLDPANTKILFKLGEMAISAKNWAYAIEVLYKAALLHPRDLTVRTILMNIYRAYQMPIQEIITGKEIINLNPRNKSALIKLAFLYHDQDMPQDEEEIRRMLMDIDPENYENLKALANLLQKKGDLREEILVYQKITEFFPDKNEDKMRLAKLYELNNDRYNQLNVFNDIFNSGSAYKNKLSSEYISSYKKYYHDELRLLEKLNADSEISNYNAPEYNESKQVYETEYTIPQPGLNSDIGIKIKFNNLSYEPKNLLIGKKEVRGTKYDFFLKRYWDGKQNSLKFSFGKAKVDTFGTVALRNEADADSSSFPMLEAVNLGGTVSLGEIIYEGEIGNELKINSYFKKELLEDLDAYVRLFTRNVTGIGLSYVMSDLTNIEISFAGSKISDGNYAKNYKLNLNYYLWAKESLFDYKGIRKRFIYEPPLSYLLINYSLEKINFKNSSSFYKTFENELEHSLNLTGNYQIKGNTFLKGGLIYETGKSIQSRSGFSLGLFYRDPSKNNEAGISYNSKTEKVALESQLNKNFEGETNNQAIKFEIIWHY